MKITIDDLARVVEALYPDWTGGQDFLLQQTLDDEGNSNVDAEIIEWPAETAQPTEAEILAKLAELESAE